jgi:hypothetical protein
VRVDTTSNQPLGSLANHILWFGDGPDRYNGVTFWFLP